MDVWFLCDQYADAEDHAYRTFGDSDGSLPFHVVEDFAPRIRYRFLVVRGDVPDEQLSDPGDSEYGSDRYQVQYTAA